VGVTGVDDVDEELLPPPQPQSRPATQTDTIPEILACLIMLQVLPRRPYAALLLMRNGLKASRD
jgi:hypothetical protein